MILPTILFLLVSTLSSGEPVGYNSFSTTKCTTCQAIVTQLQPEVLKTRFAALCSDETCPELAGLPSEINPNQFCSELKLCPYGNFYKIQDLDICQTCAVAADFVIDNIKDPDHLAMVESILDTVCVAVPMQNCQKIVHDSLKFISDLVTMEHLSGEHLCDFILFNIFGIYCRY